MENYDNWEQSFKEGDFLQSKNPYKGEHEKMVVKVDTKQKEYHLAWMKGVHSKEADFENLEIADFEEANRRFIKVG